MFQTYLKNFFLTSRSFSLILCDRSRSRKPHLCRCRRKLGISFHEENTPPTANASTDELAQYDAYYMQDTDEKILYLTFDAGYENGKHRKKF